MPGIDESLNWVVEHWYYWALMIGAFILVSLYQQVQKLKNMYQHWTDDRLKERTKFETKVNPSTTWKWLCRLKSPYSRHVKLIGRIRSYNVIRTNPNEITKIVSNEITKIVCDTRLFGKLPLGNKRTFMFNSKDANMDAKQGLIIVPYNIYWNIHPSGEYILINEGNRDIYEYAQQEIIGDLNKLNTDGYASQMSSYSSVKPTWGHEERIMEKENEGRALGFGSFLKKKKEPQQSSSDE